VSYRNIKKIKIPFSKKKFFFSNKRGLTKSPINIHGSPEQKLKKNLLKIYIKKFLGKFLKNYKSLFHSFLSCVSERKKKERKCYKVKKSGVQRETRKKVTWSTGWTVWKINSRENF
jgi:CRISPR/Cas system endoribonuclease Cas6 (RAMP superfamily)